ncbi:DNA adenine methylase [Arenibaculum pallidiluteum]|uniref:DNA adenine methylase n=1 Tax=Arenibaculum pallidiluteum TaxID=2812559 RepID=UPI001A9569C2|nr:DNA adenine methylase [Arenibaculum pallidiluteum]
MKYMGSKRYMLTNGLGEALAAEVPKARRFIDLFTGSGAVAAFAATRWDVDVLASDLQKFAVALAASVICRDVVVNDPKTLEAWIGRARARVNENERLTAAKELQEALRKRALMDVVGQCRELCSESGAGPIEMAYGGYYFSPQQAIWLDALRATLPQRHEAKVVALAALIGTGSRCAAAPGHTAQPFQPTCTAGEFLLTCWSKDVVTTVMTEFNEIGRIAAKRKGQASVDDALAVAKKLMEGDLAFIDPPYSAVHYSRFYHVLETIASGTRVPVSGAGRYPPLEQRPISNFSIKSKAASALRDLLQAISSKGARAVVTFPAGNASNGLSGKRVVEIASEFFHIDRETVTGRFSTLGGNRVNRAARQDSQELILTLSPK